MNVKRKIAGAMAAVMLVCLVIPQTALAARTWYTLGVTITEEQSSQTDGSLYTVRGTSGSLSGSESLTGEIAMIVGSNYTSQNRTDRTGLYGFGSQTMNEIVAAGLSAHEKGAAEWAAWVADFTDQVVNVSASAQSLVLNEKLSDLDTPASALTPGSSYVISYTPENVAGGDPAQGNTYVVTLELTSHTSGSSGGGSGSGGGTVTTSPTVTVEQASNGSTSVGNTTPSKNEKVTVTATPDEGYVSSRVIVTDENGNRIPVTYQGNNQYTFVMPESQVTVEPVYETKTASLSETGVGEKLNAEEHIAYMVGFPDGDFHPSESVTRAQVAQIFYRLLKTQSAGTRGAFSDVDEDAWYTQAVEALSALGIVSGYPDGTFRPNQAISRAEFTAICVQFAKKTTAGSSFVDVPSSHWAYESIGTASGYNWISGVGDNRFAPNEVLTRAAAATIVNRMLYRPSDFDAIDMGEGRHFSDVPESFWGYYAVTEACTEHDHSFDTEVIHEDWDS